MKRTQLGLLMSSLLIALAFNFGSVTTARAQCEIMQPPVQSAGTDFAVVFEQNFVPTYTPADSSACTLYIASTADIPVTVTITCRHFPSMQQQFILTPRGSVTWEVSQNYPDIWVTTQDSAVNDRVLIIHATSNIVCYGMNYVVATADAFLALPKPPVSGAGADYRIMSYTNSAYIVQATPSQFAVAAFENNTVVEITPAADVLSSTVTRQTKPAGQMFTVTLDAGQCVQVQTDPTVLNGAKPNTEDLTGSIVHVTKPVAVYAGHARTEIPFNYTSPSGNTSRDYLQEQMPPTSTWEKDYVLAPFEIDNAGTTRPDGDLMRVLAREDNTVVTINSKPTPWRTLNAGQYADTLITKDPILVSGSNPILVGEYAHTSTMTKTDAGDPFLAIVSPMGQTYNKFTFFVSTNPVFNVRRLVITAKAGCINDITLDGSPLPNLFKPVGQYYIMSVGVTPGPHQISTTAPKEDGFTILSYGMGYVISYGYTAGALLEPKQGVILNEQPKPISLVVPGSGPQYSPNNNRFETRNLTLDEMYLDEVVFTPTNPADARYNIQLSERLDPVTGRVPPGETNALHLTAFDEQPSVPVPGAITIYHHGFAWHDLAPATMQWTYYPPKPSAASVDMQSATGPLAAIMAPNPLPANETRAELSFSMPETADLEIAIYDELGRCVRTLGTATFPQGQHTVRILRQQSDETLAPGTYRALLRSHKLAIAESVLIVVQ